MKLPDLVLAGYALTFVTLFFGLAERERRLRAARLDTFTWDAVQRGWRFNSSYARGTCSASIGGMASTCPAHGPLRSSSPVAISPPPPILRWWNAAPGAPRAIRSSGGAARYDGRPCLTCRQIEGRLARFAARRRVARPSSATSARRFPCDDETCSESTASALLRPLRRLLRSACRGGAVPDAGAPRVDPSSLVRLARHRRQAPLCRPVRRPHRHRLCPRATGDVAHVAALVEAGAALTRARG